jgi:transcriptional regulator with XRE-family HTH domain
MMNVLGMKLRAKKLGVLIRDARLAAGKSIEDCARILELSETTFNAYELGDASPSLPELELLAYYLNTPLEHFWGDRSLSVDSRSARKIDFQLVALRQRMIGASCAARLRRIYP